MNAKERIEEEILKAMDAMDTMRYLIPQLPKEEGSQSDFMSNLSDMKSKLKHFLNKDFDKLARQRKEK
jgi:hypothetical protein